MSNTIIARLADMQATLAAYNSIETDLATVVTVLNTITNESSTVWRGTAADVFSDNMCTLMTQVRTIAENVAASKVTLTSAINAYKALEDSNIKDITTAGDNFLIV